MPADRTDMNGSAKHMPANRWNIFILFPKPSPSTLSMCFFTALRAVIERLGIAKDHAYAFGDGRNDLCMFREAGHTVAMGNGAAELKAAAEFVTTDIHDDGVKNGLQHFNLI